MKTIYPAIDLWEGKVVRLRQGDFEKMTVYSNDPGKFARVWEDDGARWLHVVDLEGAKNGALSNTESLRSICASVGCKIEFGGGVRSAEDIQKLLDLGVERVILGTRALDREFLEAVLREYGEKIAVGIDVRDGFVQTRGWQESAAVGLEEVIGFLNNFPLGILIYTDIRKDGMLEGPNWEGLQRVLELSRAAVLLSGGVSSIENVRQAGGIRHGGFAGMIIGKALYEEKFTLREALEAFQS